MSRAKSSPSPVKSSGPVKVNGLLVFGKVPAPVEILTGTVPTGQMPLKAFSALMHGHVRAAEMMGLKSIMRREGAGKTEVMHFFAVNKDKPMAFSHADWLTAKAKAKKKRVTVNPVKLLRK